MSTFGSARERLASILNDAFAKGLLSGQTHSYRLGLVFGARLIDQQRVIGDLTCSDPPSRSAQRLRDGWSALVEHVRTLKDRGGRAAAPLLLALEPVRSERLTVGRDPRCDVVLSDPTVSRRHAQLTLRDGMWMIRDLGSTNGTFVNGAQVVRSLLRCGDIIALGAQLVQID